MDIGSLLQSAGLGGLLDSVEITTNLNASAPITLAAPSLGPIDCIVAPCPQPAPSVQGGPASIGSALAWLQPQIAFGKPGQQIVFAPYGSPSADYGLAALSFGVAALLGVAGIGAAIGKRAGSAPFFFAGGVAGLIGLVASRRSS